jgi:hypothetical protein
MIIISIAAVIFLPLASAIWFIERRLPVGKVRSWLLNHDIVIAAVTSLIALGTAGLVCTFMGWPL